MTTNLSPRHAKLIGCLSRRKSAVVLFRGCMMLCAFAGVCASSLGQQPCGLQNVETPVTPVYAPIARAAHVEGTVIAMVRFAHDGSVESVRVLSGPRLLLYGTEPYFKGLRAEPSIGSRECPFVVRFELHGMSNAECGSAAGVQNEAYKPVTTATDPQHFLLTSGIGCVVTMYSLAAAAD